MEKNYSDVLCKEYKTLSAYKTALTKYEKYILSELREVEESSSRGIKTYLGEPIIICRMNLNSDLKNIKKERENIQIYKKKLISE